MKNNFSFLMKSSALFTVLLTALLTAAYLIFPTGWILASAITFGTTAITL